MLVRGKLAVRYIPGGVRDSNQIGVRVECWLFLEVQGDRLVRLPAAAGDGDGRARRVIGFVSLNPGEAVQFAALKRVP